jgi:kumamolisin
MKVSSPWAAGIFALLCAVVSTSPLMAVEKAELHGRAAATQTATFNIYLPVRDRAGLEKLLQDLQNPNSASYHKWLTPDEFDARFAADARSVEAIRQQLGAYGLKTERLTAHRLQVTGTARAVEQALATTLENGRYRSGRETVVATRPIVPLPALSEANAAVTGLSGMIRMRTNAHKTALPENRYSSTGGYWFDDLKQAYSYPSYQSLNGKGATIGILMDGDYNSADMDLYFGHEKLATPKFSEVLVNGGAPFDPNGDSFETELDMQQSGGMAPKANVILYNIPDLSDDSILAGLSQIVSDNKADVVNMSFGGAEIYWTAADNGGVDLTYLLREEDDLFAQGNAQGITFVASSGDLGALSAVPLSCFDYGPNCGSFLAAAQFPATSPHVTGVGGTNLVTTYTGVAGDLNSKYVRESAFADPLDVDIFYGTSATGGYWGSGGGDSILFGRPAFQAATNTGNRKARTIPDLALHMGGCPLGGSTSCGADDSYDIEALAGGFVGVIGTSCSAPDFSGLTALNVQRLGTRLGNENYYIYSLAVAQAAGVGQAVFHQGIPGFNGLYYTTAKGYNRVLGNGTLDGVNFLLAPAMPVAGTPQTKSNP